MSNKKQTILLTGQPGVGKSTIIKQLAQKAGNQSGGFYTREVRGGGRRIGFEIVTFVGANAYLAKKSQQQCFENEAIFKGYCVNLDGIEKIAVPAMLKARDESKIIFVDEIGPMEICSRKFCSVIWELLEDDNVSMMGTIVRRQYRFADQVKKHPRVRIVEVTEGNRDTISAEVWHLMGG